MAYLKSFFFNFLIIFFANHILPGINLLDLTRLPHFGGDLMFSLGLGLLNFLIYPVLKMFKKESSAFRIAICAVILNLAAYGVLKFLPFGIEILSVEGYLLVSVVVALGSFLINYFEMRRRRHRHKSDSITTTTTIAPQ